MVWVIALLLFYCSGVSSYAVLTQAPSQSAALGNTVKLTCSLSSEHADYVVGWYQQREGQAPRLVLYSDTSRASGIPDRFSGSKSGGERYLTISGVQAEDEATYYCGEGESSGSTYMYVFGGGTHLTVLGQPTALPSVFLFPPSQEEIKTKSKATLACLMDDFYPGVVQVEWKADGTAISSGVETSKPVKQGEKYVASSYLTLSESDWKSHGKYTCKVIHERGTVEKEVNRADCS